MYNIGAKLVFQFVEEVETSHSGVRTHRRRSRRERGVFLVGKRIRSSDPQPEHVVVRV